MLYAHVYLRLLPCQLQFVNEIYQFYFISAFFYMGWTCCEPDCKSGLPKHATPSTTKFFRLPFHEPPFKQFAEKTSLRPSTLAFALDISLMRIFLQYRETQT